MKHVLISLNEEYVKKLRHLAKGGKTMRKGAISETVMEGIELVEKARKQQKAWKRLKELFDEDFKWGVREFKREDAYYGPRFN